MNLDAKINMVGFKIAEILDENMINKLLGVLANDGVYAMWVYAQNKIDWSFDSNKKRFEEKTLIKFVKALDFGVEFKIKDKTLKEILDDNHIQEIINLSKNIEELNSQIKQLQHKNKQKELEEIRKQKVKERNEKFNYFFQTLSEDLTQLLFFKEMVEKALIYARYHAKAMKDE